MKLINFMKMCVEFDRMGFKINGNHEGMVIIGQKGRVSIAYGEIYDIRIGDLRRRVLKLKRFYEDGGRDDKRDDSTPAGDGGGVRGETKEPSFERAYIGRRPSLKGGPEAGGGS